MSDADWVGPDVAGIRLFGSLGRGDGDRHSDRDILVLVRGTALPAFLQEVIRVWRQETYDVSVYTEERYRQMHRNGHLFTWHVYRESRALDRTLSPTNAPDLIDALGPPPAYQDACADGGALFNLLDECMASLLDDASSEVYEAGVLYVIARNLAIIASWQLGNLCFSANAPYMIGDRVGSQFPLCVSTYDLLRCSRKASAGTMAAPPLLRQELLGWAAAIEKWCSGLRSLVSGVRNV